MRSLKHTGATEVRGVPFGRSVSGAIADVAREKASSRGSYFGLVAGAV